PGSPFHLLLASQTDVLLDHAFPVQEMELLDGSPIDSDGGWFYVCVALPDNLDRVMLVRSGEVLAQRSVSAAAPSVTLLQPEGPNTFGSGEDVTVRWAADDSDGDTLEYTLEYSPDNGGAWHILTAGLSDESYVWNTAATPGGSECRLRVTARDGFNSGADENDQTFSVEGQTPVVAILDPPDGSQFLEHQHIPVRGEAFDPEGSALWTLWEIEGPGGVVDVLPLLSGSFDPVAPGDYTATLSVCDADAMCATQQVAFSVLADKDRDGVPDTFEERYGLDPSYAADALLDTDHDGLNSFEEARYGVHPGMWDTDGDGVSDGQEATQWGDPTSSNSVPPPDDCDHAAQITTGVFSGTTWGSTPDGEAGCGNSSNSPDVWFRYTAPAAGTLLIDTCGSTFDTVLSVHDSCPGSTANEVGCNDDCGGVPCTGRNSCLRIPVTAGESYWIRVTGYQGALGEYVLRVEHDTTSAINDDCEHALIATEGQQSIDNRGATADGPDHPWDCDWHGDSRIGSDIWYRYDPGCTGLVTVSLCGSTFDTKLAVYEGTGCPAAEALVACNDDACGRASEVEFPVGGDEVYTIRVGGFEGAQGTGVMSITCRTVLPSPVITALELGPAGTVRVDFEDHGAKASEYRLKRTPSLGDTWSNDAEAVIGELPGQRFNALTIDKGRSNEFFRVDTAP
ncbi:hypothetical protein ACFLSJ_08495, partial [Verrucomicrobiota bacterium]